MKNKSKHSRYNIIIILLIVIIAILTCYTVYLTFFYKEPDTAPEPIVSSPSKTVKSIPAGEDLSVYSASELVHYTSVNFQSEAVVSSPSFSTYRDAEYGFKIDYPSHFIQSEKINKFNRNSFCSKDGSAALKITAGYNNGNLTPGQICDAITALYGGEVTYNPVKDSWFALSSNSNGIYQYAYYKITENRIIGFEFHFYGEENLETYSKYIDHIYDSLEF